MVDQVIVNLLKNKVNSSKQRRIHSSHQPQHDNDLEKNKIVKKNGKPPYQSGPLK
jgi:hypothetical protein